ncbi:MAG: sigma-70 family RNA polymerase sigma factor, partial [Planctomycetes bacterium]|nr:sigma-70 family RNA polymerase sigma factor [Planctomycetota bacterium]
ELEKPGSYFSWLISIANNVTKEYLRDKKKFNTMAELPEKGEIDPKDREDDYELEKTIARLPESQREVLLLRYYGGLSCLEVAQKLGMPLGTVTKNLSRAYKNLRELLSNKDS